MSHQNVKAGIGLPHPKVVRVPSRELVMVSGRRIYVQIGRSKISALELPDPFDGVDEVMLWSKEQHVFAGCWLNLEPMGFAWWKGTKLVGKVVESNCFARVHSECEVAFVVSEGHDLGLYALDLMIGVVRWRIRLNEEALGEASVDICALPEAVFVAGGTGLWQMYATEDGKQVAGGNGGWRGDIERLYGAADGSWVVVVVSGSTGAFAVRIADGEVVRLF